MSDHRRPRAAASEPPGSLEIMLRDTTAAAASIQFEIQSAKSGTERVALALELSQLVRDLAMAGLRSRNPGWSEHQLFRALMRQLYPSMSWPEGRGFGRR
jgi:hypothetical protein